MHHTLVATRLPMLLFAVAFAHPKTQALAQSEPMAGPSQSAGLRERLVAVMRNGIETKSPNHSFIRRLEDTPTVFDGSYDWHSCVIAHWALLVEGRRVGNAELVGWVLDRLPITALQAEVAMLVARENVTGRRRSPGVGPYDTAWFAMLLSEIARHDHDAVDSTVNRLALLDLRTQLERLLTEQLESSTFPERPAKGERPALYVGSYRSFLLTWLLLSWSDPATEELDQALQRWWTERIEPKASELDAFDKAHPFDFVWLPAVRALAQESADEAAAANYDPGDPGDLPETVRVATVHPVGLWLSRFWPVAAAAGRGHDTARTQFDAAWSTYLAREDLWAEDFPACSHWVPQFLYIGLWLADGGSQR